MATFFQRHGLVLNALTPDEKALVDAPLRELFAAIGGEDRVKDADAGGGGAGAAAPVPARAPATFEETVFFKVPFKQAIDLVRGRRVFLRDGCAYVPKGRIVSIIVNRFAAYLKRALATASKVLPSLLADERIKPILDSMAKAYTGPDFGGKKGVAGEVRAESVDELAGATFALCMRNLQETLKGKSHLKHWGRRAWGRAGRAARAGARTRGAAR